MNARKLFALGILAVLLAAATASAVSRRMIVLYTGAAGDTTAVGMADSTDILNTGDYQRLYLHLLPNKGCRVAIQIRQHGITDTSRASLPDSNNTCAWAWRAYNGAAGVLNNQADSTTWLRITPPTAVIAGEDEMVYDFPDNEIAAKWGGPRGRYIPICKVDNGEWYWGRQTSIRLRVLNSAGGAVVTWKATLEGVNF